MANPEKNIGGALKFIKGAMVGTILASVGVAYAFDTTIVEAASNDNNTSEYSTSQVAPNYNIAVASLGQSKFKDVRADNYAYEAVHWAFEKGIISGYEDGTFKPDGKVTEAQFAKMLSNYFELQDTSKSIKKTTNVNVWSDEFYNKLASYGVPLNGYLDNNMRNETVKRGIVAQSIGYLQGQNKDLTTAVEFLINNNISTGQDNTKTNVLDKFGTNKELTRAQIVTFLYRMDNEGISYLANSVETLRASNGDLNTLAVQATSKVDKSLKTIVVQNPTKVNGSTNIPKVMWGKTELVKGQIGKVTILANTPLVKLVNGKLVTVRTLKKGEEYRVYQYKGQNGGLYGVGASSFVQKNTAKVKYETPAKSKLDIVNGVTKPPVKAPEKPKTPVQSGKVVDMMTSPTLKFIEDNGITNKFSDVHSVTLNFGKTYENITLRVEKKDVKISFIPRDSSTEFNKNSTKLASLFLKDVGYDVSEKTLKTHIDLFLKGNLKETKLTGDLVILTNGSSVWITNNKDY